LVGLWAALEIGVAAVLGLLAATRLPSAVHPDDTSTPPLGFDSSHVRDALAEGGYPEPGTDAYPSGKGVYPGDQAPPSQKF
jgi:hypothetical protein